MEKKISSNEQDISNSTFDQRKRRNSSKSVQIKEKRLPWWVEFLFVQIGLPDKWLIKLLKSKKDAKDFYKNEKKFIFSILFVLFAIAYFQPVIKYSSSRLKCQKNAKNYIIENMSIGNLNNEGIKMIAVNFCNGGNEIENFRSNK